MASKVVRIPITNIYGGGDYTAQLLVGSQNAPVNVILDTGSSTLAVKEGSYRPATDKNLKASPLAQEVAYGTGGWAGPVVTTTVTMGAGENSVTLQDSPLAIAEAQQPHNFGEADGILGLAYNVLNNAANLTAYLQRHRIEPPVTYPWPFAVRNSSAALAQLGWILDRMPQQDIPPYFDEIESNGITANKFAFYTLRSSPSLASPNPAQDPLNNGYFIMGGGEDQTDLYAGGFLNVAVVDDAWYNTTLKAVQVDGCAPVAAASLPAEVRQTMISNSIVDSGTNALFLASDVFQAIVYSLNALNPDFTRAIQAAYDLGVSAASLDLARWPGIRFVMLGESGGDATLTCSPKTYWQTDAPQAGQAMFQILDGGAPQSILGLPLMNNYFTVFDRSADSYGVIKFAPIKS